MTFAQLIDYNMRIYFYFYLFFIEKLYIKCGGETSPRPFSEKSKLSISPDK